MSITPSNENRPAHGAPRCGAQHACGETVRHASAQGANAVQLSRRDQPAGPLSPTWKSGRYSKIFPKGWHQRFAQLHADPELMSCRREISLTDLRIEQLLESTA